MERKQEPRLIMVTAKTKRATLETLDNLLLWAHSQSAESDYVTCLAETLNLHRTQMAWRYTFVASTHKEVISGLEPKAANPCLVSKEHDIIYVFSGQGSQWPGMAKELFDLPVFERSLRKSRSILLHFGATWDLFEEILKEKDVSRLHESLIGQPVLTCIQIALVDLLHELKIVPSAILGHSSGEVAAAYAAGALCHQAAIQVAYYRGLSVHGCNETMQMDGAMLAVATGVDEVNTHISSLPESSGRVMIACINSPSSTTVSGDRQAIIDLRRSLIMMGVASTLLHVDTAYHSHHMQVVAEGYYNFLRDLKDTRPHQSMRFYSSVIADEKCSGFDARYWVSNLVSKVRFSEAIEAAYRQLSNNPSGSFIHHTFIELGPHNTLSRPLQQTLNKLKADGLHVKEFQSRITSVLNRDRNSRTTLLQAMGKVMEKGYTIDIQALNGKNGGHMITDLRPYPWDHSSSYWHQSRLSEDHKFRSSPFHDLLGFRQVEVLEPTWRYVLNTDNLPWLRDHAINDSTIFPASAFVAMAIEAKKQLFLERSVSCRILRYVIRDIVFDQFLEIPKPPDSVEVQIVVRYIDNTVKEKLMNWEEFTISSVSTAGDTTRHCQGLIQIEVTNTFNEVEYRSESEAQEEMLRELCERPLGELPTKELYHQLRGTGNHWGPTFAMVEKFCSGRLCATGTVRIPDIARCMPSGYLRPHTIHPTTLDALIHTGLMAFSRVSDTGVMFPVSIGELTIASKTETRPGSALTFGTTIALSGRSHAGMEMFAFQRDDGAASQLVVSLKEGKLRALRRRSDDGELAGPSEIYEYQLCWDLDIDHYQSSIHCSAAIRSTSYQSVTREANLNILNGATLEYLKACKHQVPVANVNQRFSSYWEWMISLADEWHFLSAQDNLETMVSQLPSVGVEGEALRRIGTNIASILKGLVDPISVLFEGDLLHRFYTEDQASRQCYLHLVNFAKCMAFKTPSLRVLEIGSGTGGATLPLLKGLMSTKESQAVQHYDYTDLSPGFFEKAKSKFYDWRDIIQFQTLDIEKSPVEQGFQEYSYDLIVASNVLHATRNIEMAVANTRRLLKPGGRLILIEITKLAPFMNAIFGLLPGWYQGNWTIRCLFTYNLLTCDGTQSEPMGVKAYLYSL